jgi:hypothetical protein
MLIAFIVVVGLAVGQVAFLLGRVVGYQCGRKDVCSKLLTLDNHDEQYVYCSGYNNGVYDALGSEVCTSEDLVRAYNKWKKEYMAN